MQLSDITTPIDQLTDDELIVRLRAVRARREVKHPVSKHKAATAEKKTSRARVDKTEDLLAELTPEQREELIKKLEGL